MHKVVGLSSLLKHVSLSMDEGAYHALMVGLIVESRLHFGQKKLPFGEVAKNINDEIIAGQCEFFFDRALRLTGHTQYHKDCDFADDANLSADEIFSIFFQNGLVIKVNQMSYRKDLKLSQLFTFVADQCSWPQKFLYRNDSNSLIKEKFFTERDIDRIKTKLNKKLYSDLTLNPDTILHRRQSIEATRDVGEILLRLNYSAKFSDTSFSNISRTVNRLQQLGFYKIYHYDHSKSNGIILWAWMSDASIKKSEMTGFESLHMSELNDGENLVVVTVFADGVATNDLINDLISSLYDKQRRLFVNKGSMSKPIYMMYSDRSNSSFDEAKPSIT
jgi:hemolysin-activating ACP:hemolysin acyltransferase